MGLVYHCTRDAPDVSGDNQWRCYIVLMLLRREFTVRIVINDQSVCMCYRWLMLGRCVIFGTAVITLSPFHYALFS